MYQWNNFFSIQFCMESIVLYSPSLFPHQGGHGSPLVPKSYFARDVFSAFDINRHYHFFCEISQPLWTIISKSGLKASNFIKKVIPTPMFSCEYFEIFKNSFLYKTPPVAATTYFTLKLTSHDILHYLWSANLSKSFF